MRAQALHRHVAVVRRELLEQVQWQDLMAVRWGVEGPTAEPDLMVSEEVLARLLCVWWVENRLWEPGVPLDDLLTQVEAREYCYWLRVGQSVVMKEMAGSILFRLIV